jgi:PadR family transcriptional regulator, regulatory protein PadR
MSDKSSDRIELLQGTLDLLVLRSLLFGPLHGHGIAKAIQRNSEDLLLVEHGSLYPALYRLEQKKWIAAKWQHTPKGRPMKFYGLTAAGRKQLMVEQSKWERLTRAIGFVLSRQED